MAEANPNRSDRAGPSNRSLDDEEDLLQEIGEIQAGANINQDPFLMNEILENTFKFMSDTDLAVCAQVSQTWRTEAKRADVLRRKEVQNERDLALLHLQLDQQYAIRVSYLLLKLSPQFSSGIEQLYDLVPKMAANLTSLRVEILPGHRDDPTELIHHFLRWCHQLITVEIRFVSPSERLFSPSVTMYPIWDHNNWTMRFSKVTKLTLELPPDYCFDAYELVRAYPNLVYLRVLDLSFGNDATDFKDLQLPNLRVLVVRIQNFYVSTVIDSLKGLRLKLESLTLTSVAADAIGFEKVRRFIQSQGPTLKSLELLMEQGAYYRGSNNFFPMQLPHLRRLKVDDRYLCHFSDTSKDFPNLRILNIITSFDGYWTGLLAGNRLRRMPDLKRLGLDCIDNASLEKVLLLFPTLESLRLSNCDDSQAQIIFRNMPQLTHLMLEDGGIHRADSRSPELTDKGITAIDELGYQKIQRRGLSPNEVRRLPSIRYMRQLRIFSLGFIFPELGTENSIMNGILDLGNLEIFAVAGIAQLSPQLAMRISEQGYARIFPDDPVYTRLSDSALTTAPPDFVFRRLSSEPAELGNDEGLAVSTMNVVPPRDDGIVSIEHYIRTGEVE